jgi:hypothetical protein
MAFCIFRQLTKAQLFATKERIALLAPATISAMKGNVREHFIPAFQGHLIIYIKSTSFSSIN